MEPASPIPLLNIAQFAKNTARPFRVDCGNTYKAARAQKGVAKKKQEGSGAGSKYPG
jgi:hypothetical protein